MGGRAQGNRGFEKGRGARGPEDEELGEWKPKGRNEILAMRQNERDRRARYQDVGGEGSGMINLHRGESGEGPRKLGTEKDKLESRIEAIENDRRYEKAHSGLSTELRRLQSGVSAFDHPGLYTHIDQMATLHEAPPTHRGPMAVARVVGDMLKVHQAVLPGRCNLGVYQKKMRRRGQTPHRPANPQNRSPSSGVFWQATGGGRKILDKAGLTARGGR
jgi:hypothetical protein